MSAIRGRAAVTRDGPHGAPDTTALPGIGPRAGQMVGLPDLLRRLAAEMGALAAQSQSIEDGLAALLPQMGEVDHSAGLADLQNLDRVIQTLDELRGFLDRAADVAPEGAMLDLSGAAGAVRLGALAAALQGGPAPPQAGDGAVELF